ncbi:MAG: potassium channel protein [Bdellovibrionales bacterium]|nr:potassium channel protein [Bdellovibrionales bacterium]
MQGHKILKLFLILCFITLVGTFGYSKIEGWSILDSLYMTVITLTTIGFKEVHPLSENGQIFTIIYIVLGVGNIAYILSTLFQYVLDFKLDRIYRRKAMLNSINKMHDHTIVCGYGKVGQQIVEILIKKKQAVVVLEIDELLAQQLSDRNIPYLIGTASEDHLLEKAGILTAKNLVAVVGSDAENVFITLSAKSLNPDIHIISRITNESTRPKLTKAGAHKIISPYTYASHKIAQSILNPAIDDFLEIIADDNTIELQMADILINSGHQLENKKIREINSSDCGVYIVGLRRPGQNIIYGPKENETILDGDRLIAIGSGEEFSSQIKRFTGPNPQASLT